MTNEKAVKVLTILRDALNIAIQAIETGDVYMNAEDYNVFLEGYKQGMADMGYHKEEKDKTNHKEN